ncbi:MAG: YciI family protein [Bryobacteraceae bacterium]
MAAIAGFNQRLRESGQLVFAGGLEAPASAAVVDDRQGQARCTAGPVHPSKEYVSGFWIVEAPDREEALRLAMEASRCCNRKVELRPLLPDPV